MAGQVAAIKQRLSDLSILGRRYYNWSNCYQFAVIHMWQERFQAVSLVSNSSQRNETEYTLRDLIALPNYGLSKSLNFRRDIVFISYITIPARP
jgi:hypothetical protein